MYIATLQLGGIAIVDEFDVHLHPQILPKILDLFTDPAKTWAQCSSFLARTIQKS